MPARVSAVVAVLVGAVLLSVGTLVLAIRLTAQPAPTGSTAPAAVTDGYAFWDMREDGSPVRWDQCAAIPWVLRVDGAPPGARSLLEEATARITEAGGPRFTYMGPSDEEPALSRAAFQPDRHGQDSWAPVLVAWAPPHAGGLPLRDSDRAVSLPIAVDGVFVSGQVVFNDRRDLQMDFEDRATSWGATAIHEFVHVTGLDHVDDPSQLMHRFAGSGPIEFGTGDLDGLGALTSPGCLDTPTPRPVTVEVRPRR
jgi:hypothetical protein